MRILIIGHAYAASYNRRDKLARIAKDARVEELAVIIPKNWYDRMMDKPRHYEKVPADSNYQVKLLKVFPSGVQSKYLFNPWSLHKIVKNFNPDVIHVEQELHDWSLWEIAALNRFFWKKRLSVFVWENLRREFNALVKWLNGWMAGKIDLLIGGNRESIQIAQEQGFRGQTAVIPQFGVDEERFKPMGAGDLKSQLGLEDQFVVGFVGRYVEEKGIRTLIKALQQLEGDFTALLISSMQPPEWLKKEAEGLGNNVRFLESVPHEEFPKYMNLFDVLILPSETQKDWTEQFGRVMIEAMSCGVPVVGSSSGAIPEVVGEAGLTFKEQNTTDLARKLSSLLRNPTQLTQLANRARPYVLQNYTHDRVVEQTVDEWEKLL